MVAFGPGWLCPGCVMGGMDVMSVMARPDALAWPSLAMRRPLCAVSPCAAFPVRRFPVCRAFASAGACHRVCPVVDGVMAHGPVTHGPACRIVGIEPV